LYMLREVKESGSGGSEPDSSNSKMLDFFAQLNGEREAINKSALRGQKFTPDEVDEIKWNFVVDLLTFELLVLNLKEKPASVGGRMSRFFRVSKAVGVEVDKAQKAALNAEIGLYFSAMTADAVFNKYKTAVNGFLMAANAQLTFAAAKSNEDLLALYTAMNTSMRTKYSAYKASLQPAASVVPPAATTVAVATAPVDTPKVTQNPLFRRARALSPTPRSGTVPAPAAHRRSSSVPARGATGSALTPLAVTATPAVVAAAPVDAAATQAALQNLAESLATLQSAISHS
jgi:hypothetical protein